VSKREEQVFSVVERLYSEIQYLGRKGEFEKCEGSN